MRVQADNARFQVDDRRRHMLQELAWKRGIPGLCESGLQVTFVVFTKCCFLDEQVFWFVLSGFLWR